MTDRSSRPRHGGVTLQAGVLAGCLSLLSAAWLLQIRDADQVVLPIGDVALPRSCTLRSLFQTDCPGCGLTRSVVSLVHGDWRAAWIYNPAGLLFFAAILVQLPYRLLQLRRLRRGDQAWRLSRLTAAAVWLLLGALMLQWTVRVLLPPGIP